MKKRLLLFIVSTLSFVSFTKLHSQAIICPTVNAQVSTGPSTTICQGNCALLTASVVGVNATTSYAVGSIPYQSFPWTGGAVACSGIDDGWSAVIPIGFNFCYFGNVYNQCIASSNGQVCFNLANANGFSGWSISAAIPSMANQPDNIIDGAFRDMTTYSPGQVKYYVTGTAPCRALVVYWLQCPLFSCSTPYVYQQIVLYETTNIIDVNIQNSTACTGWNSGYGIVGIQNIGATIGVAAPGRNFPNAWSATNESWRFTPSGASTYTVNWVGPTGPVGSGLIANVCPTVTSTYTANAIMGGCVGSNTLTSTVQVVVVPSPTLTVNSPTVCLGSPATLTGGGASTYTWLPGNIVASSITFTPAATTTYTLIGKNASGCSSTITTVVTVNPLPVIVPGSNSPICSGNTLSLTVGSATSYTWTGPNAFTSNLQNPTITNVTAANAGNYTVAVTSSLGCKNTAVINVVINPTPTVTPTNTGPYCVGNTINLSVGAASSYTWTGPNGFTSNAQNPSIANSQTVNAGVYTVTVTTAAGCKGTGTTNVIVSPLPIVTPTNTGPYCSGATIFLSVGASTSYTWTGPNAFTSNLQNPTIANGQPIHGGVYTVTVTNVSGCKGTGTTNVIVNPTPTVTPTNTGPYCAGATINLSVGAATSYTWTGPNAFTSNLQNPSIVNSTTLNSGVYTVNVTSAAGCIGTGTTNVIVNPLPIVAPGNTGPYCIGSTISLTVAASTSYTWTGPNAFTSNLQNPTIANAQAIHGGVYTVTVTNASGCKGTGTTNVVMNPLPTPILNSNSPICVGGTLTLNTGVALSYTWTGPSGFTSNLQNPTISNVTAANGGVYTATVTNAFGCKGTATINVVINPLPVVVPANTGPYCAGATINLSVGAATSYTWSGPNGFTSNLQNPTIANSTTLSSGVYTVSVTNASGCIGTGTTNVIVNPLPVVLPGSNSPVCTGNSINLTVGAASTYTWSGPSGFTSNLQNPTIANSNTVNGGTYTVTITSTAGCVSSNTIIVVVNNTPTVSPTSTGPYCVGNTINLSVIAAASYTWTGPNAFSSNIQNPSIANSQTIHAGVYSITLTSVSGCKSTGSVNVVVNPLPTATITSNSPVCSGNQINLSVNASTSYTWAGPNGFTSNAQNPTIANAVIANGGNYTVTVTNGFGCTTTSVVSVVVNPTPTITINPNPAVICLGNSISLTASGATAYTWTPATALNTNIGANVISTPVVQTTYTVLGSALNCTNTGVITVSVLGLPSITVTPSSSTLCMNNFNGSPNTVTLNAAGAASYTWGPIIGLTTNTLNGSSVIGTSNGAAVGTGTVIGANGTCTNMATFTVNAIPNPTIAVTSGSMCAGTSVTLSASGASTFTWSPSATLNTANGSPVIANPAVTTVYSVIGSSVGCNSQTQTGTATVVINPTVTVLPNPAVICLNNSINLTASGATDYTWTPATALSSTNTANTTANPLVTTTYSVIGSAATCTNITAITVTVLGLPAITITPSSSTLCINNYNGSPNTVTLNAAGAASYTWGPITGLTTNTLNGSSVIGTSNGLPVGTGTVIGANGTCTNIATFTVNAIPNPVIAVTSGSMCFGTNVNLTSNGANTYTWSPSATLNTPNGNAVTASPSVTTVYSVIGSSVGCQSQTQTGTASVVPNPTVTLAPISPTICIGGSINLTANGATDYTWTPVSTLNTNIGANVIANPTLTTTYTVLGSQATCTHVSAITVAVINLPVVNITANSSTLCMNNFNGSPNTVTFTASGATTYTWGPISGLTTNTLNGSSIIGTSTGASQIGSVTVMGTAGTCTNIASFSVAIIPNPIIAVTSGSMCFGTSVNLTSSGANTYTWSPSTTLNTANGNAVIASPSVTSVYSVIGSSVGCQSQTQNGTASVVPNPTTSIAPLSPTICIGTSINLTASGATDYTWTPANTLNTSIGANVTANPTVTTTYTVIGSQATCTNIAVRTVTVVNLPVVNISTSSPTLCMNNFNGSPNTINLAASGASSYTWTGFVGLNPSALNSPSIIATSILQSPIGTGSVIGMAGTCTNIATFSVNVLPNPIISVSSASMCFGTSATLVANGASTYFWSPSSTLNSNVGSTVIATPPQTSVYNVVGNSLNCKSITETATVTVVANPVMVISPVTPTICAGSPIGLTAFGANNYTWTPAVAINTLNGAFVIVNPTVTTNYVLIGEAATCTSSIVRQVLVTPLPDLQAISDKTVICVGDKVNINANGANSYTWMPTTGLSSGSSNFVVANPASSITYTLIGTNGVCTTSITFGIDVNTRPVLNLSTANQKVCKGQSTTIFASGCQGYHWAHTSDSTINASNTTTNTTMIVVTPSVSMNYTVTGFNSVCPFTKEILIDVVPTITPGVSSSATVCEGKSVKLEANGSNTYQWFPTEGLSNPLIPSPYAQPKVTTTYSVRVSDGGFCAQTATILVRVMPQPTVYAGPDATYNSDELITLNATGTGTLSWIFGDNILCHVCPNSQITPTRSGVYHVQATNQFGCTATDLVWIELTDDYPIFVPNSFTPNFDGLNDVFLVYGEGIIEFEMMVFNRWQHQIFSSNDQLKGWDGTYKGELVKNDSYIYVINYKTYDNRKHTKTGYIAVLKEDY